jgi:hypothetical protein
MLPNQQIFERGYMQQSEILDPFAMRPYINRRGQHVVSEFHGYRRMIRNGKQVLDRFGNPMNEPILVERPFYRNALLQKYDWEQIDQVVQDVHRLPLPGIDDLRADGLVQPLDGIGVSITTYEQLTDMSGATVAMNIVVQGDKDRPAFNPVSIPVPIISKPFSFDLRTLSASGRNGHARLDTTTTRIATIKCREALEDILFNGSDVKSGDAAIYGYTTLSQRDTATATQYGGGDFATDGNGHKTFVGMIEALRAKGYRGPFRAYVANTQYSQLLALTGLNKSETQLSVIQRTIPNLKSVVPSDRLADGNVVVVQMTVDSVDLAVGQDLAPVSWMEYGGAVSEFRVLGAMVPRIKYDANGYAGVAHATGA